MQEDLDYLSLVILKDGQENRVVTVEVEGVEEKGYMIGKPKFIHQLELVVGFFKETRYTHSLYEIPGIIIKESKHHYYFHLTGFFFLKEDYRGQLIKIFEIFKNNNRKYHITRLDYAYSLGIAFSDFSKILLKTKVSKKLTKGVYSKNGENKYISIFNSRFKAVAYDKNVHLKSGKVKEDYRKFYFYKFGSLALTRFEYRIKSKAELAPMTQLLNENPEKFLNSFAEFSKRKAEERLFYSRSMKKILSM